MNLPQNTWFVIAAYNEAGRIGAVLEELMKIGANVVVIDDCSADTTSEVCAAFNCVIIRHPINLGQGAALQTGMDYAKSRRANIVVHFDADGQMQLKDVPAMVEPIVTGAAQVTLGSRYLHANNQVPWSKRWFIHFPAVYLQWFLTGLKLSDAHCGFRALSAEAVEICKIKQNRMAHATEILELISDNGLRYKEVPVDIKYHQYGQRFKKGIAILFDLFLLK